MYQYNKLSFLLIFVVLILACQSDAGGNKIAQLEKAIATNPTAESIDQLLTSYRASIQAAPEDATVNATTIGKIAAVQLKGNQVMEAVETLTNGIRNYYSAPATADNLWALGDIYKNALKSPSVAKAICKVYADKFPSGKHVAAAKQLVGANPTSLSDDIEAIGGNMYNEETHRLDTKIANDFIRVCEIYALIKPEDSKSPDYLHKAGETARAIRAFPRAISIYDRIYASYPNFEKAPQALFLKAFTYDNDLKEVEKARALYTEFLKKYPNDDFADDTEFLLKNLGKNDEEIIKSFNKK